MVGVTMRHRNAGIGQPANSRGNAGHHTERNLMLHQRKGFLATTAEDKRITALQPQHAIAFTRQLHQPERNIALLGRWLATAFAGIFQQRACSRQLETIGIDQRVMHNHIRLRERIGCVQRQQTGVTRACTHEPHFTRFHLRQILLPVGHAFPFTRAGHSCITPWVTPVPIALYNGNRQETTENCDMSAGESEIRVEKPATALRRGWTTGACATAATKAALTALISGDFPDPIQITLPKGETPSFALARESLKEERAMAGIIKDAGDDPDVTHGALVMASVRRLPYGAGIVFKAGTGVGTVTKAGLPVAVGEPAINPVPRKMMSEVVAALCAKHGIPADVEIEIGIENGAELALQTWNPRLGIIGGLSVLGTTGIVHPFSCSAWIHSIHRGIDVARAEGFAHVLGATGSTSEKTAQAFHNLSDIACLDMGDFAGGLLKYLRVHPVPRLTIAGGFAKLTKLAQGALDLHSGRSQVDMAWLATQTETLGGSHLKQQILNANTALEVLELTQDHGLDLAAAIAMAARETALETLRGAPVEVDVMVTNRIGKLLAHAR